MKLDGWEFPHQDMHHLTKVGLWFANLTIPSQITARPVWKDQTDRAVFFIFHAALPRKQRKESVRGNKT